MREDAPHLNIGHKSSNTFSAKSFYFLFSRKFFPQKFPAIRYIMHATLFHYSESTLLTVVYVNLELFVNAWSPNVFEDVMSADCAFNSERSCHKGNNQCMNELATVPFQF